MSDKYKDIPFETAGDELRAKLGQFIDAPDTTLEDRAHAMVEFLDLDGHQGSLADLDQARTLFRNIAAKNALSAEGVRTTMQIAGINLRRQLMNGVIFEDLDMYPYQQILLRQLKKVNRLLEEYHLTQGEKDELVGVRTELAAALILQSQNPHAYIPLPAYARVDQSQAGASHLEGNKRADLMIVGTKLETPVLVQVKTKWEDKYKQQYYPGVALVVGTAHLHFDNDQGQRMTERITTAYEEGSQAEKLYLPRENFLDELREKIEVEGVDLDPLTIFGRYMTDSLQRRHRNAS
jgi:hypothetical protein